VVSCIISFLMTGHRGVFPCLRFDFLSSAPIFLQYKNHPLQSMNQSRPMAENRYRNG